MNWCILIPLLVGAICALLGYLLGKLKSNNITKNDVDIDLWKNKISQLEADLKTCNKSKLSLENNLSEAKLNTASFVSKTNLISFNSALAKEIFGKKVKENDLKIVEGIGPKIEGLFHDFDIKTWKDLGESSIEKCQEVLNSGGDRYRIHKPTTWPKQAKLAYEGKWQELRKWQDKLDGGK